MYFINCVTKSPISMRSPRETHFHRANRREDLQAVRCRSTKALNPNPNFSQHSTSMNSYEKKLNIKRRTKLIEPLLSRTKPYVQIHGYHSQKGYDINNATTAQCDQVRLTISIGNVSRTGWCGQMRQAKRPLDKWRHWLEYRSN